MGRNVLKDLKESTVLTMFEVLSLMGMKEGIHYQYKEQAGKIIITNGNAQSSTIYLLELKYEPSDPMFNKFGSKEYCGGFIEEGQEVTEEAVETLSLTRIRYKLDQFGLRGTVLIGCNPHKGYLYTGYYRPYVEGSLPENRLFIPSLLRDNPFASAEYKRKIYSIKSEAIKQRLIHGNWDFEDSPDQLIPYIWLDSCFTPELPQEVLSRRVGVDIANEGDDKTVLAEWNNDTLVNLYKIDVPITDQTDISGKIGDEIIKYCTSRHIGYVDIHPDAVGVGVGVRDYMRGKGWYVDDYKGGEAVATKSEHEQYANLRTYSYWMLREGMQNRKIKIWDKIPYKEELRRQLTAHTFSTNDKVIILEKKDLVKKKIGVSPDFADAMAMGYAPQPKINFAFAISHG